MYYEFYTPVKINSGIDALFTLPNEIDRLGSKSPLIVTDEGIVGAGILKKIESVFKESKKQMPPVFSEIPVETSLSSLYKALEIAKREKSDSIIAVGGGSVIDSAKLLSIMLSHESIDIKNITGVETMPPRLMPFIVIPTTSGTGSEVTSVAVIFNEIEGKKIAFASSYMMPDVAILDPEMVLSMPPKLTVSSAIDALSHAIEAYIGIQSNPISKALAFKAVSIILKDLPEVLNNGKNKRLRMNLLTASTMAGAAFSNSMVGMVHSLAHAVGSVLHIPHGEAVSLFLVPALRVNFNVSKDDFSELLEVIPPVLPVSRKESNTKRGEVFVTYIDSFIRHIKKRAGISMHLKDYGFKEEYRDNIIKLALLDGSSIFSPVDLTEEVANLLIEEAL